MGGETERHQMKNTFERIKLPNLNWMTGSNINLSLNSWCGSVGCDPETGSLSRTTMSYTLTLTVEGDYPNKKPVSAEVTYKLVGPYGSEPLVREPVSRVFPYTGDVDGKMSEEFLREAEDWLNAELSRLCDEGVMKPQH